MISVSKRLFFFMSIDGREIDFSKIELSETRLMAHRSYELPIAEIKLVDKVRYFNTDPLMDGQVINISLAKDKENDDALKVYSFRVYRVKTRQISTSIEYTISCIANYPRFLNESSTLAYTGTVSKIGREIAEECGLDTDIDNSSDFQRWYCASRKRYRFLKECVKYAYLDNTSCFISGVSLEGVLKIKNLSALDFTDSTKLFVKGPKYNKKVKMVLSAKENSNSGMLNNVAGYKYLSVKQNADNTEVFDAIQVPLKTSVINVNSLLNENLQEAYVDVMPVDCYNTHPNYVLAYHQNKRVKSTFGQNISIMLNEESEVDLFTPVKYIAFENMNNEVSINNKISGGYIVTGKVIKILPGYYYEKLTLTRQGHNLDVISKNDKKLLGV